jgi:hypothetical protein
MTEIAGPIQGLEGSSPTPSGELTRPPNDRFVEPWPEPESAAVIEVIRSVAVHSQSVHVRVPNDAGSDPQRQIVMDAATHTSINHLERETLLDPMTGTGNRRALDSAHGGAIAGARRLGFDLLVVAIDLDGLKQINDRSGHPAGDRALTTVACTLVGGLRISDAVYRTGEPGEPRRSRRGSPRSRQSAPVPQCGRPPRCG